MNQIVSALSQLLKPGDRECACGDIEELRLRAPAAAANILGLVIRRQLAEWSHWKSWAALLGVVGLTGSFLSGSLAQVSIAISLQIRTYLHYGVAYNAGGVSVAQQITFAATAALAMLLWSWGCGFVLASLSGRALWATSFLFYCIVQNLWMFRFALAGNIILMHGIWITMLIRLLPVNPMSIAFLLALGAGIRSAKRGTLLPKTRLSLAAVGVAFLPLLVWMESWFAAGYAHWSGQTYLPSPLMYRILPLLAGAWPVFSIPLLQDRQRQAGGQQTS